MGMTGLSIWLVGLMSMLAKARLTLHAGHRICGLSCLGFVGLRVYRAWGLRLVELNAYFL